MNIGLIGCGRVGTTMLHLLRTKHTIVGVHDISPVKVKRTMRLLHLKRKVSLKEIVKASTVLFVATPDDAILDVYRSVESYITGRKYVFHFSGALPSTVFPKKSKLYRAAVHPFATFPRLVIPPKRKHLPLYVEGDLRARAAVKRIFPARSFSIRYITRKNKLYCHLAGVFASNFVVALLIDTLKIMKKANMHSQDLKDSVLPIVNATLSNIESHGVYHALSGPLQRGDIVTIKKHLDALRDDPLLLHAYRILSHAILDTLPDNKQKRQLQKLLRIKSETPNTNHY